MVEMKPVSDSQGSKSGHQELNEEIDIPHNLHDIEWEYLIVYDEIIGIMGEQFSADLIVIKYNITFL